MPMAGFLAVVLAWILKKAGLQRVNPTLELAGYELAEGHKPIPKIGDTGTMFKKGRDTEASPSAPTSANGQPAVKSPSLPSIISADLKVVGDLHCTGDVHIEGTVEGEVTSRTVTIGEGAQVSGPIHADTIEIYGTFNGAIEGNTVTLARTAKVNGDIAHKTLSVEAGAHFEGHSRRLTEEVSFPGMAKITNPEVTQKEGSGTTADVGSRDATKLVAEAKERIKK